MTSVDGLTLTALNHALDEAMDDEKACEAVIHAKFGTGAAIMYGIQPSVKECGCPGLAIPHCRGCMVRRITTPTTIAHCVRCDAYYPGAPQYIRWEPIR